MANLLVSDDILNDGKVTKSTDNVRNNKASENLSMSGANLGHVSGGHNDSGSYSRFFSLDAWHDALPEHVRKVFPFLIVPKAPRSEKTHNTTGEAAFEERKLAQCVTCGNKGLKVGAGKQFTCGHDDGIEYVPTQVQKAGGHPTQKPLTLMSYLITLGSRPGDVVLDPFLGSGTTACAAKSLGRGYVGIEREEEYVKIAESRINAICTPPKN